MKLLRLVCFFCTASSAFAQSIGVPWSGHGHDPQHTGISQVASQSLGEVKWYTPVDLMKHYTGSSLLIHYGSPLITRQNTVIFPVKTGFDDGFKVEARNPVNGALKWTGTTDYSLPGHNWIPSYVMALTPKNRLYFAAAGAKVNYRDSPDAASGPTGQISFYGTAISSNFNDVVKINTPITSDRYGNIYFGFEVTAVTDPPLESGIARIAEDGTGSWRSVKVATADSQVEKVVHNCAPALSNDQRTLYFAASANGGDYGYLVSIDSRTLAPIAKVRLKDARKIMNDASLPDDGSASPTVGPDGDVYFGVLENPFLSNHLRGWLLHFDSSLTQLKTPGAFGWDDTASVVPASLVPSYQGTSAYLLLTKYNNYAGAGGDGVNKLAILDPNDSMIDPVSGGAVMKEVITRAGPTPDYEYPGFPAAVREWCINTAAIDPFSKSALASCEDGSTYRWDFVTNTFTEAISLTSGIGEAYTPTVIGVDGTVYAIANGILFAIGAATP